jgi:hypothetical protein
MKFNKNGKTQNFENTEETKNKHFEDYEHNFGFEDMTVSRMLDISKVMVEEMSFHMSPQRGLFE